MPQAALRPCTQPGCPALVPRGRCGAHQARTSDLRGSAASRGYDRQWRRWRESHLRENPICVDPYRQHIRPVVATVVDHIQPHCGDQATFWAPDNFQSLCARCHGHKTREEMRAQ